MLKLDHVLHEEFVRAPLLPFLVDSTSVPGGKVRSVGAPGAGNVTYVLSILVASMSRQHLIANAAWLLGSGGTVLLDFVVRSPSRFSGSCLTRR